MPEPVRSASTIVDSLSATPLPMIFLDTAAILDILRVPFRREIQVNLIESAAALVEDLSTASADVYLASTSTVWGELQSNRERVMQELRSRRLDLDSSIARFAEVAHLVLPEHRPIERLPWLNTAFEERVQGVMDRLADSLTVFRGSDQCALRARDRLLAGDPPASRSKQEFKDCLVFEEFLELARALRDRGFTLPVVFVSSNTSDYGRPPAGHPRIESDLATARAQFAGDLAWARAIIRE